MIGQADGPRGYLHQVVAAVPRVELDQAAGVGSDGGGVLLG
jgi:hypothetical protein